MSADRSRLDTGIVGYSPRTYVDTNATLADMEAASYFDALWHDLQRTGTLRIFGSDGVQDYSVALGSIADRTVTLTPLADGDNLSGGKVAPTGNSTARTLAAWLGALNANIEGADYTLLASDHGKTLLIEDECDVAVPPDLPANFRCEIVQFGADPVTLVEGLGVTINEPDDQLISGGQWARLTLQAIAADEYLLSGPTAAA